MKTGTFGIDKIKFLESFVKYWTLDTGKYSIGYGHNEQPNDRNWIHEPIDREFADLILRKDLVKFEDIVNHAIKIPLSQKQFDILILWVYNTGRSKSTLYDLINKKASTKTITNWWKSHYITVNDVTNQKRKDQLEEGLRNRRKEEADLWEEEAKKLSQNNTQPQPQQPQPQQPKTTEAPAAPTINKNLFFLVAAAVGSYFLFFKKKKK